MWICYKFCKRFCPWCGHGLVVAYWQLGRRWGSGGKALVRTTDQHWAREAFKAVLLPVEMLIQLKSRRHSVEDSPVRWKLVCWCVRRKNNTGVELCVAIPAPDSGNNQCWARMLHQSKKCSDVQLRQSWLVLANRRTITIFPYFQSHAHWLPLFGGTGLLSLHTCLFPLCSLWVTCSKKPKNPQSFMIQKHSKLNMYWSDTSRSLSANQSVWSASFWWICVSVRLAQAK